MGGPAKAPSAESARDGGARSSGRLRGMFAVLALAIAAFAITAASASAEPPAVNMGTISNVSYSSATVTGAVTPTNGFSRYEFQYSTDEDNWVAAGPEFAFLSGTEEQAVGPFTITGLKGGTHYFVRLIATNFIEEGRTSAPYPDLTTLPVDPPTIIAMDNASGVFSTSAGATGTVKRPANTDPAFDVKCRFEYVTDADFTATGYAGATVRDCQPSPIGPADANTDKAISAPLGCTSPVVEAPEEKCLKPATTYHLRMVTENASPTVVTKEAANTFTTAPTVAKPTVIAANDATDVTYQTAKVTGEIQRPTGTDPALDTNCRFEYVTDADFNATGFETAGRTSCVEASVEAPLTGPDPTPVTAELTGLKPGTTYHLRLTAENGAGSVSKDLAKTITTVERIEAILEMNPVAPADIGYTTAHVTGTIDSGEPQRYINWAFQVSTEPTMDNPGSICCEQGPGRFNEYSQDLGDLLPGTKYYVRIYGFDVAEAPFTFLTSPEPYESFTTKGTSALPIPDLDPVTDFTATTAHFSGTVNPNAPAEVLNDEAKAAYKTDWHLACTPECKDINGNVIGGIIEAGAVAQPIAGDAARLDPNEHYEVTLVVHNHLGTVESTVGTFDTPRIKPTVKASEGASDGKGGYTIQGVVNPHNATITDCRFEWGPTAPNYAFSAPCSPMPVGRNEVQEFSSEVFSQFVLTFRGETTGVIPDGASAGLVESELKALAKIGPAGIVKVTRSEAFFAWVYHVSFGGPLAERNVAPLSIKENGVSTEARTVTAGGNSLPIVVEAHLTGLTPEAVYHFDLFATNGAGEVQSGDKEFVPTLDPVETCPNEQARKENNSLALPECRAYEMVTPPGKEGFRASIARFSGDTIAYTSNAGNLSKSGQNGLFGNSYVAVRTAAGWETVPNLNGPAGTLRDAPSLVTTPTGLFGTFNYSENLRSSIWRVHRQDAVPGENFYLRNQDGTFTLIGPNNGTTGIAPFENSASSADLTHLVRWGGGEQSLWGPGVYESVGTGNEDPPRRVDVDNSGSPIASCPGIAASGKTISRDGRVIVLAVSGGCGGSSPPANEIWARIGGTTSVDVSASQCTRTAPTCNAPVAPEFVASTPDGSRVFFTTTQQLVNGDTDEANDLYACDIPPGTPVPTSGKANPCAAFMKVSVAESGAADVESVRTISKDGSTIMFTAKGVLAANSNALGGHAIAGDHNFYVWRQDAAHPEGQTTFLARLESDDIGSPQTTPDGRYLVFTTASQLVETDTDNGRDVYRYDVESGELTRVSTNVNGVGGNGDALDAGIPPEAAVSDDGTKIVFESAEALSAADGNAAPDVYLWTPHRVFLVTTGAVGGGSLSNEAGSLSEAIDGSGKNLFFHTPAALSPADGDDLGDVYDARVGGGFSFAEPPACSGEACQSEGEGPQVGSPPATIQPPPDGGNVKPKRCSKGKVVKAGKCVKKKSKKHHKKPHRTAGHNRGGSK